METAVSVKLWLIITELIIAIACLLWSHKEAAEADRFTFVGCLPPLIVWCICTIILLICWIIFI